MSTTGNARIERKTIKPQNEGPPGVHFSNLYRPRTPLEFHPHRPEYIISSHTELLPLAALFFHFPFFSFPFFQKGFLSKMISIFFLILAFPKKNLFHLLTVFLSLSGHPSRNFGWQLAPLRPLRGNSLNVTSRWARSRSGLRFAAYWTARTQLKSYLIASYGLLDKKAAAWCGSPLFRPAIPMGVRFHQIRQKQKTTGSREPVFLRSKGYL